MPPVALELAGFRFGRLLVLGPASMRDGMTAWRCKCDCGKEVDAKTAYLRAGRTRSCGCLRAEKSRARIVDMNARAA